MSIMTRSHHPHARQAPARDVMMQQRAASKKKKPYKIVLEAVTQEKKKLHSILTYASDAPAGFGFIPAGNPEITEWCKEQCRQRNLDVHIVSAKPKNKMHSDPEKLSHHVHRVGHHFPLDIINLACSKFGYMYSEHSGLQKDKSHDRTNWIAQRVEAYSTRNSLRSRPTSVKEDKEHTRGAIREMFPKIPEADLDSIVNHAFEEGTNRVGNAKELSLARRVQLAVVAHIRHVYTDYDKILKNGSWMEARQKVEHVSLAKLKEWRDETGEQSDEIEETFREIIVLDDDDEESSDGRSPSMSNGREPSMEIVSSRATARDLQPESYEPGLYADRRATRSSRRTIVLRPYDAHLSDSPQQRVMHHLPSAQRRTYVQEAEQPRSTRSAMYGALHSRPAYAYTEESPRHLQPVAYDFSQMRPRPPPPPSRDIMQEIDGRLYHLEPIRDDRDVAPIPYDHSYRAPPSATHHSRATSRAAPSRQVVRPPTHSRRNSEQDVVLPSVECEVVDLTSPRRMASGKVPSFAAQRTPQGFGEIYSPKRKALPYSGSDMSLQHDQGTKRLRPIHEQAVSSYPIAHDGRAAHGVASSSQPINGYLEAHDLPRDEYINLTSSPLRPPPPHQSGPYIRAPPRPSGGPTYISPLTRYTTALHESDNTPYVHSGSAPQPPVGTAGMRVGPPADQMFARDQRSHQNRASYR